MSGDLGMQFWGVGVTGMQRSEQLPLISHGVWECPSACLLHHRVGSFEGAGSGV